VFFLSSAPFVRGVSLCEKLTSYRFRVEGFIIRVDLCKSVANKVKFEVTKVSHGPSLIKTNNNLLIQPNCSDKIEVRHIVITASTVV